MTIASTVNRMAYVGSGTTGPYAYTFRVFAASDLLVTKRDPSGLETTLHYPGDFTVTGIGQASGGTITLTTALPSGWALSIRRVRALTQDVELRNQGPYQASVVEEALDKRAMAEQTIYDVVQRAPRLPESISPDDFDTTLPANLTPGNALVVNATGDGFAMATLDDATLSAWNATNNIVRDVFTSAHGDFTPGSTTTLTLSQAPGASQNLTVIRRTSGTVVQYLSDEYTLAGQTLTFSAAIPTGTTRVEVVYLHTYQLNTADAVNVTYAPSTGSGTDVRTRLRSIDSRIGALSVSITEAPYNADPTGVADATAAFNDAAQAVADAGGGSVIVPLGTFLFDAADLVVSRLVDVQGIGVGGSILRSTTGKKLKVKGGGNNWDQTITRVGLDGITVWYGETSSDFANGCVLAHVDITNCDIGVYYGWNCFQNAISNCKIHNCDVGVHYDVATAGVSSGALMYIGTGSAIFQCRIGIRYTGGFVGGFDAFFNDINIQDITEAGIKLETAGEDCVFINVAHFELYDSAAAFIVMDGGHVFIDGMWALSATERVWFDVSGGEIYLQKARGSWFPNKFAKITGGSIVVDPDFIFCASRWFGEDAIDMVAAGSTGGKIIGTRSDYIGRTNKTLTQLTNASPGPLEAARIHPRDGNEYRWEFDVDCTANLGTNNTLRVTIGNGHSTVRVDLVFPLSVVGGAHVTVYYSPGTELAAVADYLPSGGVGTGLRVTASTTDTSTLDDLRFLLFETVGSGTKATMQVKHFYEYICAPHQTAL